MLHGALFFLAQGGVLAAVTLAYGMSLAPSHFSSQSRWCFTPS